MTPTVSVSQLLGQAEAFFHSAQDQTALQALQLLTEQRKAQKYKIALVGGVSRGKTRLLNNLLDTDIFPESSIPTTTVLTEVSYGPKKSVTFCGKNGEEQLPADNSGLERFSAEEADADKSGYLRILWPAPFLKPNLVLMDTPGIDDTFTSRANITYNALEDADAALVVIAANAPVSMLEQSFIKTYLEDRSIPHIAVVIAFLDIISPAATDSQIQFIQKKIARIDPDIEVWLAAPAGGQTDFPVSGPAAIASRLHAWANDPKAEERTRQRDLKRCLAILQSCLDRQSALIRALELDKQNGEKAFLQASEQLNQQKEEWKRLAANFLGQARKTAAELDDKLLALQSGVIEAFQHESEEKFRLELRPRLSQAARELTGQLRENLAKDTEELKNSLGLKFDLPDPGAITSRQSFTLGWSLPETPGQNVGDVLVALVNFASSLWKEIGPMLPIPVILRGQAQKIVEKGLNNLANFLGMNLGHKGEIETAINDFFITLKGQLDSSVTELYAETAEQALSEETNWLERQKELLSQLRSPESVQTRLKAAQNQLNEGENLKKAIQTALTSQGDRNAPK